MQSLLLLNFGLIIFDRKIEVNISLSLKVNRKQKWWAGKNKRAILKRVENKRWSYREISQSKW